MSITCPKCRSDNPETLKFCGNCGTKLNASETGRSQGPEDRASFTRTLEIGSDELTRGMIFAGRYEIIEELGTGGMGRVYRAHDTKLNEEVALKLIKPEIAADKRAVERFRNEIKVARKITHKNVCRTHDLHQEGKTLFLTMEYVRGEDLKSFIRRAAPLNVGKAVFIAREIAEGLSEAHTLGIVHRDLKPGNIMIDKDGQAKIMDFGIARVRQEKGVTGEGVIVGTPEYMSPEQVEAKDVDQRSDIYSLGIILYEMVTGRVPFEGETPLSIILKHKGETPRDPRDINAQVPSDLSRLILRCLEKDKNRRYQEIEEILLDLIKIEKGLPAVEKIVPKRTAATSKEITVKFRLKKLYVPGLALIVLLAVAGYFIFRGGPKPLEIKIGRTQQMTHDPGLEIDPALSPDGKMIAYAAGLTGKMALFVRQIGGGEPIVLTKTLPYDCRWPQWSPDGTQILFQSQGSIYLAPALGGTPKRIIEPPPGKTARCATWSPDGRQISYIESPNSINVLTVNGGETRKIAQTETTETHSLSWSPDGSIIAFVEGNLQFIFGEPNIGNIAQCSIWIVPTRGGRPIQLTDNAYLNASPAWTPDGKHILFVSNQGGSRDVYVLRLSSTLKPLNPPVRLTTGLNAHSINISPAGNKLAYSVFTYYANIWSITVPKGDPISISEAQPITSENQAIEGIDVSPDGKWLAYDSDIAGNQDIYKMRAAGGEAEQLTNDPSDDFHPDWSPDGQEIAFHSFRTGNRDIFLMTADGSRLQQLTNDRAQERYTDWSPDGQQIVFQSDKTGRSELFVISRKTKDSNWSEPRQLTFDGGMHGKWSPDGSSIAYTKTTRVVKGALARSVLVIPAGGGESRTLVKSPDSAVLPGPQYAVWSPDNKVIYYMAFDAEQRASFWSVAVSGGKPRLLVRFDDSARQSRRFEFTTDGQRFFFTLAKYESDVWIGDLLIGRKR